MSSFSYYDYTYGNLTVKKLIGNRIESGCLNQHLHLMSTNPGSVEVSASIPHEITPVAGLKQPQNDLFGRPPLPNYQQARRRNQEPGHAETP